MHWAGAALKIVGLPQLVLKGLCYMVWFFMHRQHIAHLQVIEGRGSETGLKDELHKKVLNSAALSCIRQTLAFEYVVGWIPHPVIKNSADSGPEPQI